MADSDDLELRMKLLRMQRRLILDKSRKQTKPPTPELDPESVVRPLLRDRGEEVLQAAQQQFPEDMRRILEELASLIKAGEIREITGSWLYTLLNQIGIPVRLKNTIQIISDGKASSIADKIKER